MQNTIDMPVMQLYGPANLHAVHLDHDYLELTAPQQFLQSMRVSEISQEEAKHIELETREQRLSKAWKQHRQMRLTASRYGEICKATIRKNKAKLAQDLLQQRPLYTAAVNWGITHEEVALRKFESVI